MSAPTGPAARRGRDRFAWRAKLKANPVTNKIYRIVVGIVGTLIVLVGIVLLPAPGPGWLIVFGGLAVLASEFDWAKRLLRYARRRVREWSQWTKRQSLPIRILVVLAIIALVLAIFWGLFALSGVPGWIPDVVQTPLQTYVPGL